MLRQLVKEYHAERQTLADLHSRLADSDPRVARDALTRIPLQRTYVRIARSAALSQYRILRDSRPDWRSAYLASARGKRNATQTVIVPFTPTVSASVADPIASIPVLRAALNPATAKGKVSIASVRATVAAWRGASVARIADPIRMLRPVFECPAKTADGLRAQAQTIHAAGEAYRHATTQAEYVQTLLEALAEHFAAEPRPVNPDLSDAQAEYRAKKALTPSVQAFARKVEGCKREAAAARLTLADAASNREKKRLSAVVYQRDKTLAAALADFHTALDRACEAQGLPMFIVRPEDRANGFALTDNGSWRYDYRHHGARMFANANAKPWQV